MKRVLILVALQLGFATSYANPTHSSQRADPAVSAAAGWVVSDAACDAASRQGLDWREVSQQPMNLDAFGKLAEKFVKLVSFKPKAASRFLVCLNREVANKGLAETLMLHKSRLQQSKEVRAAFLHYVINTANDPALADEKAADLKSLFDQYRRSLVLTDEGLEYPPTLEELREYGIKVNEKRYGRPDVMPATLLGLDERDDGYSSRDATWMAELSVLAYWLEKKISFWRRPREGDIRQTRVGAEEQLEAWGYDPKATRIFDKETDTSAFLAENSEHLVLAFKGTAGKRDIITDAKFGLTTPEWEPRPGFQIHSGFSEALDGVWEQIEEKLLEPGRQLVDDDGRRVGKPLWVTGHSLGAALAQLAALRMRLDTETSTKVSIRAVYTFGTPRIGNEAFVQAYDKELGKKTFPHVNHNDLVTLLPPGGNFFTTAREGRKEFIKEEGKHKQGHVLKSLRDHEKNWTKVAGEALVDKATTLILDALSFLPDTLEPKWAIDERLQRSAKGPPSFTYDSVYEEGALNEHGSSQYLFKLACCVVAEQLWPIEKTLAGMQVPPPEKDCVKRDE